MIKKILFIIIVIVGFGTFTDGFTYAMADVAEEETYERQAEGSKKAVQSLTPDGSADLTDNISESDNLRFITVTTREGSVFYIIIDTASSGENVYFLNEVDNRDIEALIGDGDEEKELDDFFFASSSEEKYGEKVTEEKEDDVDTIEKSRERSHFPAVMIILALLAGAGVLVYKYIILPKKVLSSEDGDEYEYEYDEYEEREDDD